jgi:O-antigen/teichoic acid export membrane protein
MTAGRAPNLDVAEAPRRGRHRAAPRRPQLRSAAVKATAGRLSWGLADQAVSSMTNFAVGIYVARSLGVIAFGIFSVAWVTYGVVLNISRGLATDPLVVRFSGVATEAWRAATAKASGTALRVGLLAGVVCLLAGIAMGGEMGWAFIALGLILPALLLQDSWRFAFFAAGHGRKAFANDAVWAVALIPAMIFASRHGSVLAFVLAWGVSGAVAAVYGIVQVGIRPRATGVGDWLRQQRDLGPRYLIENVSSSGSAQIRMYGLGALAGLASVGTVRGAELLLGPFLAVLMGLSLVTVAEAARVLRRSPHRLKLFCMLLGGVQAAAAMFWGIALLLLLSNRVGEFVLGEVWHSASALIVPATLSVMGASFTTGAAAGLRALGVARRSLRSQVIASAMYVTGGLLGAWLGGALGSSWGVATATWLGAVVWWLHLRAGLRERAATPPTPRNEMRTS